MRDRTIDIIRSTATTTVVFYHWVFTIIVWRSDGPHADNPIGYVSGLWSLTWILQVMPLFFMAGGYTHSLALRNNTGSRRRFIRKRFLALLIPTFVLITTVILFALTVNYVHDGDTSWLYQSVKLILSPLWFLAVFLMLVVLSPIAEKLHEKLGEVAVLLMISGAVLVDVLRFYYHVDWIGLLNMIFVWGACHQVGFSWDRLRNASKRFGHSLIIIGFTALFGFTNMGLYPRSMVGTTSALDRFSNMGPPTLPIIALCCLQIGLIIVFREKLEKFSYKEFPSKVVNWLNSNAMPLFLWHSFGFGMFYGLYRLNFFLPEEPSFQWWISRPLWLIGPLIFTTPLLLFSKLLSRRKELPVKN